GGAGATAGGSSGAGSSPTSGGSRAERDASLPAPDAAAPLLDASPAQDAATDAGSGPVGPDVDRRDPKLHEFTFEPRALAPSVRGGSMRSSRSMRRSIRGPSRSASS